MSALLSLLISFSAQAKDYRNKMIGDYSQASVDLGANRNSITFLEMMKTQIYPLIKSQAPFQTDWRTVTHLDDIENGIGAELKLSADVTTYHVKYQGPFTEKAEQSGRR
ncbi:MAG: hypothetical protein HRT44_08510, partial [Bdellovibrionales bacterium]|nr:hypothetical protein [Bdellovibrionales bacterium]